MPDSTSGTKYNNKTIQFKQQVLSWMWPFPRCPAQLKKKRAGTWRSHAGHSYLCFCRLFELKYICIFLLSRRRTVSGISMYFHGRKTPYGKRHASRIVNSTHLQPILREIFHSRQCFGTSEKTNSTCPSTQIPPIDECDNKYSADLQKNNR